MNITVLGTGIMGTAVARRLLSSGHAVTVWNRTGERAEPLREDGASVADTAEDAVRAADVVLLTLFDATAVLDVMARACPVAPDAVWVQASTIGTEATGRVSALAEREGVALLEAMMLGTRAPAEQGQLTLLVAGPEDLDARVAPAFEEMAAKVVRVGPDVGQAAALKLAANAWIAVLTAATAQSLAMTRGLGLDPHLFLDAIADTPVDSRYAHVKGEAMISSTFDPSFTVDGVVKDVGLIISAADQAGVPSDLLESVQGLFRRTSEAGHGADDMAAVISAFSPTRAG